MRAVRQVRELLELFTQSELADTGSTGDVEESEKEPETGLSDGDLPALLAKMICLLTVKVWFE